MQLSNKAIEDFKKIYLQEYGVELPHEEVNRLGIELLQFVEMIYKPIPLDSFGLTVLFRCDCLFGFSVNKRQLDFNWGVL